jgi:hypothetical protein
MALVVLKVDLDRGAEENGPLVGLDRSVVENVIGTIITISNTINKADTGTMHVAWNRHDLA